MPFWQASPMTSPAPDPAELVDLAVAAARAAGAELRERATRPAEGVESKSTRTDLVSAADRAADELIQGMIRDARPADAMLTEESGDVAGDAAVRWVIDPLDGTINFLWGIPHWAVSIAADVDGRRAVGVVLDPCKDELFVAVTGEGATLNGEPIHINPAPPLDEALVATGFHYSVEERRRQSARMSDVVPVVRDIRRFGAAALDLCWLAAGRFDGYYERGVKEWDWAAGGLVAQEAGARLVDLPAVEGRPFGVAAAHPDLVDRIRGLDGSA